ncbi:MAG TPA: HAD family phosphatase [Aggregatilineales bacterium]|nr:HAD family phosphatase [Aggregatilineales bacterium]
MGVQAIIFDYGNVLDHVDDPRPWLARRDAVAARFNMSGDAFWDLLYQTEPWQECKRGRMTYPVFWNAILSPLGLTDSAQQAKLVDELFEGRDHINAQMVQLLRELKPHYRLGVLSNTHDPHMAVRIRDQHGLKNVFDDVVSSAAVGLAKPDPEIYWLALQRLDAAPGEALFVDDMLRNTRAAQALGIPAILFENPAKLQQELKERGLLPDSPSGAG